MSGPMTFHLTDEDYRFKDKQENRNQDHPAVEDVFANLLIEPCQVPVRVPG